MVAAPYSLGAQCISEFVASFLAIWLGESVIANELLGQTKGKGMGFGWIAYGFGLAFFFPILTLGYISAHVNPAMCLGLLAIGKISGVQFICLSLAEFAGMFVGACFVYLHFAPHFKTVPEPSSTEDSDNLLRTRDALNSEQLNFVSYNTRADPKRIGQASNPVVSALQDVKYYLSPDTYDEHHIELIDSAIGTKRASEVPHDIEGAVVPQNAKPHLLRRRSVQVADMHERLKDKHMEEDVAKMRAELLRWRDLKASTQSLVSLDAPLKGSSASLSGMDSQAAQPKLAATVAAADKAKLAKQKSETKMRERLDALYVAAIRADQNAKLSVFATRPAIHAPIFNWLAEFMGTVMLIGGANLAEFQVELLYSEFIPLYKTLAAFYIGLMIQLIVLGLGGPTGVAINPARDFSPRLAHFLLPIPGKGSSEWNYSWIPFTASFAGGVVGAWMATAINTLNHSQVVGAFYDQPK